MKLILKIEDKVGEFITMHIIGVSVVLVIGIIVLYTSGYDKSWLSPCGVTIAACITVYQWVSDRRVKRSELLNELIKNLSHMDIEKIVRHNEFENKECNEEQILDLLTYMSYICHLRRTNVLSEREFASVKWDIVKVLENISILSFINTIYKNVQERANRPYHDLLVVGAENCNNRFNEAYKGLLSQTQTNINNDCNNDLFSLLNAYSTSNSGVVVAVGDGKSYQNHLEILNGIFNMGYRAHMRGAAKLPNNSIVWFPKYHVGEIPEKENRENWENSLMEDGKVLYEIWPSTHIPNFDSLKKVKRIVFGMDVGVLNKTKCYKFLGIYECVEKLEDRYKYIRVNEKLTQEDVKIVMDAN